MLYKVASLWYQAPATVEEDEPLLLDDISAAAAFSVRKLRTDYAGACMRVRRSSDNTEADIGFDEAGDLDTTALLAHVGAGSGYIRTWYDQSGNARDAGQSTASYQARVVNVGVVEPKGIMLDGSNDFFATASGSYNVGSVSTVANWANGGASQYRGIVTTRTATGKVGASNVEIGLAQASTGTSLYVFFGASLLHINGASQDVGDSSDYVTGVPISGEATTYFVPNTQSAGTKIFCIGADSDGAVGTRHWNSWIGEVLLFPSALSSDERGAMQTSQKAYFGTP